MATKTRSNRGTCDKVLEMVWNGELDNILSELANAATQRRKLVAVNKMHTLKKGDKVTFNSHCRPKYLVGVTGTVVRVNQSKVVVSGLPGRFAGREVNVPATLLDIV